MGDGSNQESSSNNKTSNSKFIYMMSGISLCCFVLLLLFTEFIFDASIIYQKFTIILTVLFILVPLLLIFFPVKGFTKYIAIGCCIMTVLCCACLFWYRNKVTIIWADNMTSITNQEVVFEKIKSMIEPAGVAIIAGSTKLKFKDENNIKELSGSLLLEKFKKEKNDEKGADKGKEQKPEDAKNEGDEKTAGAANNEGDGENAKAANNEGKGDEENKMSNEEMDNILTKIISTSEGDNKDVKTMSEIKGFKLLKMRFSTIFKPKTIQVLTINSFSPEEIQKDKEFRKKHGVLDITELGKEKEKEKEKK